MTQGQGPERLVNQIQKKKRNYYHYLTKSILVNLIQVVSTQPGQYLPTQRILELGNISRRVKREYYMRRKKENNNPPLKQSSFIVLWIDEFKRKKTHLLSILPINSHLILQHKFPVPHLSSDFIFVCAGSSLLHGLFSSCRQWGLLSSCGVWASHCGGFSCCRVQVLGCVAQQLQFLSFRAQAQQLWHTGLVAPQHVGSSWIRDGTHISCISGLIIHH